MRFLREVVLANFGLKVLAFAISLGLWMTYVAQPLAEVAFQVPVAFVNLPRELVISGDVPPNVNLRVRGRMGLVRRITPSDLTLTVDLSAERAGSVVVQLTPRMSAVPYGITVVRIAPQEFRISLAADPASQAVLRK